MKQPTDLTEDSDYLGDSQETFKDYVNEQELSLYNPYNNKQMFSYKKAYKPINKMEIVKKIMNLYKKQNRLNEEIFKHVSKNEP